MDQSNRQGQSMEGHDPGAALKANPVGLPEARIGSINFVKFDGLDTIVTHQRG